MRNAIFAGEKDSRQVHLQRLLPDFEGSLDRPLILGQHDAGIVEHDVDPAEDTRSLVEHIAAAVWGGDIARDRNGFTAELDNPARDRVRGVAANVACDHGRALAGEFKGCRLADSAAGAADKGALPRETHIYLPLFDQFRW